MRGIVTTGAGDTGGAALAVNGERQDREYEYDPTDWFEPYLARRRACGRGLYGSLGITREKKDRMNQQRGRNYIFFGAPVGSFTRRVGFD